MKRILIAVFVLFASVGSVFAEQGNPNVKSIDVITFGPDGLLVIGDSRGSAVVTVETGDLAETKWTGKEVANIDQALAGKLGVMAKDIQILKLAVNPASHKAFISVRSMKAKQDVLLTIDGAGKIAEFSLENVKFSRYPLSVEKKNVTKITDVTWAGDRILVAVQAADKFAARIFSVLPKGDGTATCFATDTYHVAHQRWETNAPISTIIPYEENGKRYLIGAFTCTPIVKFSLDDMQANAKVKGASIIELGSGNTPRDMFVYEKGGKKHILVSTIRFHHKNNPAGPNQYWAARVDYDLLKETTNINDKAIWRVKGKADKDVTDRANIAPEYFGVQFMDKLDNTSAVVIREEKDGLTLRTLLLP
ncbi:MAG: hypothetical protein EXS16_04125 [Gemmataceae bacterium]|nr:hypothetical protein [Gemmataceae bacterium]